MKEADLKKLVDDIRTVVRTIDIGDLDYGIAKGSKEVALQRNY